MNCMEIHSENFHKNKICPLSNLVFERGRWREKNEKIQIEKIIIKNGRGAKKKRSPSTFILKQKS